MITGYYCTNIFSEQAKELIEFYREILKIPFIKTDVDDSNGVYLGFVENTPTLCNGIAKYSKPNQQVINPSFFRQKILIQQ